MHNSDSQNAFTTNSDPVFPSTTHLPTTAPKTSPSKLPLESDFQDNTERDEILSTGQSTSKRPLELSPTKSAGLSSSNRQNAVRIKDLLEDIASTRRSIENQGSLMNQYKTLDPRANTSVEYNNNNNNSSNSLNNSVEISRSFHRASSANTLGYRNRANNSAFMAAYQQPSIVNMSVLQDAKRKLNNIGKITPLHREQRPQSSSGYRLNLRSETSLSPSTGKRLDRMDSSMLETDFSVRMETMPDTEYASENARQTVVERKEAVRHFKKQGVQKYENKVLRQELERQMKSLENRVKRLTTEENTIKKNIKKTEDTMLKAITVKQRMQEDMAQAHAARLKRFQDEQKARERIKEERMKRESTIKFKVDQMKSQKAMNANQLKTQKYEGTMKMSEDLRREEEKKQMIYQSTSGFEKIAKMKKKVKDMMSKEQMDENHIRFLQEEHMRTLEIERRIQELARKEERLIDHIKATHQIQVRAENIMKKVLTTKVELPKESETK